MTMKLTDLQERIPADLHLVLAKEGITELRPAQEKAIAAGLLEHKSVLVCTPTASGKTLIAEFAAVKGIMENRGKAVYIVPLVALANEKCSEFKRKYAGLIKSHKHHPTLILPMHTWLITILSFALLRN